MSSNATSTEAGVEKALSTFNFTGGFPTTKDLAPSIVFTIAYAILLPLLAYRVISRSSRTTLLIRPGIFTVARVATWVLRCIMSTKGHKFVEGELIAELVLVSVGFLFILSPLIDLWGRHVISEVPKEYQPVWLTKLVRICQVVLLVAIITAVVGAANMNGSSMSTQTVETLRKTSYILSFAVVAFTLAGVLISHIYFHLHMRGTAYLVLVLGLCFVIGIYRVVQIYSSNPDAPARSAVAFYILQAALEWFAVSALLGINLNEWFPGESGVNASYGFAPARQVDSFDNNKAYNV